MTALSAVDIALWDLEAKRMGVPLWRLLGGRLRKASRVYYTHWGASIEDRRTPEAFRDWAIETRRNGWTAVKWTLAAQGTEPERIARGSAELAAIRGAVGSSMDLCLEAAETFSIRSAIDFAKAVEKYRPLWIEEPTLRENPAGLGEVGGQESSADRQRRRTVLAIRVSPAARCERRFYRSAGCPARRRIREMRKIASLAETYGVEVAPHQCSGPVGHVASLAAMSACRNFLIQEWEAADDAVYRELTDGTYPTQS